MVIIIEHDTYGLLGDIMCILSILLINNIHYFNGSTVTLHFTYFPLVCFRLKFVLSTHLYQI